MRIRRAAVLLALFLAVPAFAQKDDPERQCIAGNADACGHIALDAYNGTKGSKDLPKALAFNLRACAGAPPDAPYCRGAGETVEAMRRSDDDVKAFTVILGKMAKACESGALHECNAVGTARLFGSVGESDPGAAKALFAKACEGGVASACANLADLLAKGERDDRVKALALYAKSCASTATWTCKIAGLGEMQGVGGEKNPVQAVRYFKRGCDGRDQRSCMMLMSIYQQDPDGAPELFRKACGSDFRQCADYDALVKGARQAASNRGSAPPR
jgi:TPR repeat protein